MPYSYYINEDTHKIHRAECSYLPKIPNKTPLGSYPNDNAAVKAVNAKAKAKGYVATKCSWCCDK